MKAEDRFFVDGVICTLDGVAMRVANLSVGGLYAATERPPMRGQLVVLEVALRDRPPFNVTGLVTWVNPPETASAPELPPGFGIKITKIAFPDKLAILDLLRRAGAEAVRRRRSRNH